MKFGNYILNRNCSVTKGYTRSLIVNGDNQDFLLIPNDLATILLKDKFEISPESKQLDFFNYLFEKRFIFQYLESSFYEYTRFHNNEVLPDSNLIIDIDSYSKIEAIIRSIDEIKINFVQIRIFQSNPDIEKLLSAINDSVLKSFEIASNPNCIDVNECLSKYPNLYFIKIYGSDFDDLEKIGLKFLEFSKQKMFNQNCCGKINTEQFIYNKNMVNISRKVNSCLFNKFSIDASGNFKNCPAMSSSYGNIMDSNYSEALIKFQNSKEFKITSITKDKIDDCKICEFRDVCIDCRAIRKSENIYSKPSKCFYNPKLGQWLTLIFILILNSTLFSQSFNGKIIDVVTEETIPNCKIINLTTKTGVYSSENGFFRINLSGFESRDTLRFYSFNNTVKDYVVSYSNDTTIFKIEDERIIHNINEVTVKRDKWSDFVLNDFNKPEFGNLSIESGGRITSFIDKSDYSKGEIKSIDVYIKQLNPTYKIVLKLFSHNPVTNSPKEEILLSKYEVVSISSAGWQKILLKDDVFIPETGLNVCFEILPIDASENITYGKGVCGITAVRFGSYHEPIGNGNRTMYSQFSNDQWFSLINSNSQFNVSNVLNLAVRVNLRGYLDQNLKRPQIKIVSTRKVKRKLHSKTQNDLSNSTIKELVSSIFTCIQSENLKGVANLIVIEKSVKNDFYRFMEERQNDWLTDHEKKLALKEWKYLKDELNNSQVNQVSEDFYEVIFPNGDRLMFMKEDLSWKLSVGYEKIVTK